MHWITSGVKSCGVLFQQPLRAAAILVSSRTYVKAFWAAKTALPMPGHMHKSQKFASHNKTLSLENMFHRQSNVRRIRKFGYDTRMSTAAGRVVLMKRILKQDRFLAQR